MLWGSVIVVKAIEDVPAGTSNPEHPLSAFVLGRVRLVPSFAGTARRSEQVEFFYLARNLAVDSSTGKADATAVVSVLRGDRTPIAMAPEDRIVTGSAASSVGPIPLAKYEPGKYIVQLKVTDRVAKRELAQESPLEVLP